MKAPLFSILHTSARPDKWRAVYVDWMSKAIHPEDVEYVLCVDPRWGFSLDPAEYESEYDNILVVQNTGRRCYVDGVNIAAKASTGTILIVNADDQFACEGWDDSLRLAVTCQIRPANATIDFEWYGENMPFVIEVDCGGHEHQRGIMPMPILSRARYEAVGYVFYPEYESMCADNDFFSMAYQDGVVIDARHLLFPHRHPMYDDWKGAENDPRWDAAYQAQNRPEARKAGMEIFSRRNRSGFPPAARAVKRRTIVLCLPGEEFSRAYRDMILRLQGHLLVERLDFEVVPMGSYSSNVYITRDDIRRALANMDPAPDLCLWLDDDNLISPEQFDRLVEDLDAHPEVDGVSAWCWIYAENKQGFTVSCGFWAADHLHWDPMPATFAHERGLKRFECGGFPCFLMRYSAMEKAGESCFLPVVDNRLEHGLLGEDFAFFLAAEKGGANFLVDPQVRVPHLKKVSVEPVLPNEGGVPVKVACMMRVKNEARWIKHTIDSVRELCGDLIFVMEDGSTDDTRAICEAAGVVVLPSPFEGQGLDEARDKNWLLQEVISRCHPDWIVMPDGDEELEAGGCAKIRRALETNPPCDCFALRFLYFWDSIDQVRIDGVYGKMARQSLFRADSNFKFKSYYSEGQTKNQNHVGLHTSNAPGLGGKVMSLNVALLHYGYLHREDRIAKYRWITSIDPHNEGEGFYQHCVQGDLPEFPASAKLMHAGPLVLQKLPAHMVPKFDVVPGPRDVHGVWICEAGMRCPICDWPLAATAAEGCVPGNCSYRPEVGSAEYCRITVRRARLAAAEIKERGAQLASAD